MIPANVLEGLSTADKVRLMETIWADLCRTGEGLAPPDWHGDVLESREARVNAGEATFRDWDEVKRRIRESRE